MYTVIKTIRGHKYVYRQRTYRKNGKVCTESTYVGPAGIGSSSSVGSESSHHSNSDDSKSANNQKIEVDSESSESSENQSTTAPKSKRARKVAGKEDGENPDKKATPNSEKNNGSGKDKSVKADKTETDIDDGSKKEEKDKKKAEKELTHWDRHVRVSIRNKAVDINKSKRMYNGWMDKVKKGGVLKGDAFPKISIERSIVSTFVTLSRRCEVKKNFGNEGYSVVVPNFSNPGKNNFYEKFGEAIGRSSLSVLKSQSPEIYQSLRTGLDSEFRETKKALLGYIRYSEGKNLLVSYLTLKMMNTVPNFGRKKEFGASKIKAKELGIRSFNKMNDWESEAAKTVGDISRFGYSKVHDSARREYFKVRALEAHAWSHYQSISKFNVGQRMKAKRYAMRAGERAKSAYSAVKKIEIVGRAFGVEKKKSWTWRVDDF